MSFFRLQLLHDKAGLAVPRDVAIVGFDNLDVSAHVNPRLTTIDQHVDQLMRTAVELLSAHTNGNAPRDVPLRTIAPLLVPRESTAASP